MIYLIMIGDPFDSNDKNYTLFVKNKTIWEPNIIVTGLQF